MSERACATCGCSSRELRPYGKGGTLICYKCGMADPETTKAEFAKKLGTRDALLTSQGPIPYIGPIPRNSRHE